MNETTIASEPNLTPPLKSVLISVIPDKDSVVSVIQGASLDSRRVYFEMALLSLCPESVENAVFALPTPSQNFSLGIQRLATSGADSTAIPHSLALTAGLIAHGYVPDEWLCGLMTPATVDAEFTYVTTFDSQGVYGRSEFVDAGLVTGSDSGSSRFGLLQKHLKCRQPVSVIPPRPLEVLYVDYECLHLDKVQSDRRLAELSEALEILVEDLPAPSSDLCSAGLRWLAAEVK